MICKVEIVCPGGMSFSCEYPISGEGDLAEAVRQAIIQWQQANPGGSLFDCEIKIGKA